MKDKRFAIHLLGINNQNIDWCIVLHIFVFMTFSANAIAQIVSYLLLVAYICLDFFYLKKGNIFSLNWRLVKYLLLWFGLFVLWVYASKIWAYGIKSPSYTLSQLIRMVFSLFILCLYTSDYNRSIRLLKSFVLAAVLFGVVVMLTNPPSTYGNEYAFGKNLDTHRNTIAAVMAEATGLAWILDNHKLMKNCKLMSVFMIIVLLCSGSRGAIVELAIFIGIMILFENNVQKKIKVVIIGGLAIIIAYVLVTSIPYLYNEIYTRFINMFISVANEDNTDGSVYSRAIMRKAAFNMFLQRPILGYGLDGVTCYINDNPMQYGYKLRAVYSHCNFTEIGANFGIIGLLLWYIPIFKSGVISFLSIKKNRIFIGFMALLVSCVVLDYARIPWQGFPNMFFLFVVMIYIFNTKCFNIDNSKYIKNDKIKFLF